MLVHVAVIALLILVSFTVPQPDEDAGGIPVMMGNVDAARGFDDPSLVDVDVLDEEAPAQTQPELPSEQDLLTQTEEETVTLKPKTEEPKKETVKPKEVVKPKKPVKKPEKTEAEKAAEAKRLAEAKAERERKAAEEAARKKVAGAFGKGSQMTENKGTSAGGTGTEGSKEGNSSTGAKTGTGGYVACHTTGKPEMAVLDKILYIADYIEPRRYKADNLPQIRRMAYEDLDQTMYAILKGTLEYLQRKGGCIDPMTLQAYEYFKAQMKGNEE